MSGRDTDVRAHCESIHLLAKHNEQAGLAVAAAGLRSAASVLSKVGAERDHYKAELDAADRQIKKRQRESIDNHNNGQRLIKELDAELAETRADAVVLEQERDQARREVAEWREEAEVLAVDRDRLITKLTLAETDRDNARHNAECIAGVRADLRREVGELRSTLCSIKGKISSAGI